MMSIRDKVAIIGVGTTKFGENFTQSYPDMIVEAAYLAFQDAKVAPSQIQAAWLGTCFPDSGGYQGNAGASLADALSLYNVPISRVANYCATGTDAFRNACFAVASGVYDIVLVVGAEKMRDVTPRESLVGQLAETGHPVVGKGVTAPGMFALFATRYFDVFGIGRETLAKVAMKNHRHGSLNPDAHFQKEITLEQYLKAPMVADPLGLYDCCPQTDGAAAAVICRADLASTFSQEPVLVQGLGLANPVGDELPFDPESDFISFRATKEAAQQAFDQAGIKDPREEIDVAEVHDCFTITELVTYEDLGFCPKGEGPRFIEEGVPFLEGELPVNTSGGLKSCGHPIGASGLRMIGEITNQLRGRAGRRQVKRAQRGLVHNLGGLGAVTSVIVLANSG
ncbi:MAG TPA: acetyl-CoA acetyltransferase [Candidatus Methylomirabilis sp.]|nr:acetyl-CoA acetyltransferase [Candidatus Methylomirabilis sp.]